MYRSESGGGQRNSLKNPLKKTSACHNKIFVRGFKNNNNNKWPKQRGARVSSVTNDRAHRSVLV
jgi:hypothetical protein